MKLDLKELALRESERVEWKENGDDIDIAKKIVKTITAFANDLSNLGGGYVICGAKEEKDAFGFPKVNYTGLSAPKLKEIEKKVLAICRDHVAPSIAPVVTELENPLDPTTRILVFTVMATQDAHTFRDKEGAGTQFYVRISRDTIEARNGILTQLLVKKQKIEHFDHRINPSATENDIDYTLLRDYLMEMKLLSPEKPLSDYLSDTVQLAEFVPPFFGKSFLDGSLKPRNFTILLFGKSESITRLFYNQYTNVSIYPGSDRSEAFAERHSITGNLIHQARRAIELLKTQAFTHFDKKSSVPNQVKYPIRALQEAVVNAIVHRNYELPEPNRITVFSDRIEVASPGALHWSVDKTAFAAGKASVKWRNQCFAYLFNKLQLAQSEGQGIPSIFRTMREEGCPIPTFEIGIETITCLLPAHPRHQITKIVQDIQDKIKAEKYQEAKIQILKALELDKYNYKIIDIYCEWAIQSKQFIVIFHFAKTIEKDLNEIDFNTILNISEVLFLIEGHQEAHLWAHQLLVRAIEGRLEKQSVIKGVLLLEKVGTPKMVIDFITNTLTNCPDWARQGIFLEKRAMSMLKIVQTNLQIAKNRKMNPVLKLQVLEKSAVLLMEAEKDLKKAFQFAENSVDRYYIEKDRLFLEVLKKVFKKINALSSLK